MNGIVQMPLFKALRGLGHRPGPFQCLTVLSVNKCFLMSSLNLPLRSFEPSPHVLLLDPREKRSAAPFPCPFLGKLQRAMRSLLSLLLSNLAKPRGHSRSSQDTASSPVTSFVALLWTQSRTFTSFLNCGAQHCAQCSRRGCTSAEYSR